MMNAERTILVVDDDDGLQEALRSLLEMAGYHVVVAADGLDALGHVERALPAMILLDIMMPRMNGYEFAAEMERRGLRPGIPIVVLTADGRVHQKAAQMKAEGYLAKPFDAGDLLHKVEALVGV